MEFSPTDTTEKDDSKEKENLNKDDFFTEDSSPLDMDDKKQETKVNLDGGGFEGTETQSDSEPLLGKDYIKENNTEEETKSKTVKDKDETEKRKGEQTEAGVSLEAGNQRKSPPTLSRFSLK